MTTATDHGSPDVAPRLAVDRLVAEVGITAASGRLKVAALIYTYRCTIACRHCLFGCGVDRPDVVMTTPQAVEALAMLHDLGRVVHIAGGEAMMYWPQMQEVIIESARRGVQPHFIETNASFAARDEVVRERFAFLKGHGVAGIYFSADPFHQEWVPADHAIRVGAIARELFGPKNVYGFGGDLESIRSFPQVTRDHEALAAYINRYRPMLVGSAYRNFRHLFEDHPLDQLHGDPWLPAEARGRAGCPDQFNLRSIWEVHIDPYGNIQTNCGVILGHVSKTTPKQALDRAAPHPDPFVRMLSDAGPVALAQYARDRHGWAMPATAKTKCSLCYEARTFLREFYPATFGPAELYAH